MNDIKFNIKSYFYIYRIMKSCAFITYSEYHLYIPLVIPIFVEKPPWL